MTRVYFNGIRNIASNGSTISFLLDDTYENKTSGVQKKDVIEVITELDAAEGIFQYLLDEINKIKQFQITSPNLKDQQAILRKPVVNSEINDRPPVGRKLKINKLDHLE